jgi:hypothetical protein
MCDTWLGKFLDYMDKNNMWKDTLLIVNTDHGFLLGEHECWAKCVHPFYNEVAHTPLFIWDPRCGIKSQRRKALVQTIDIAPTLLEYFGISVPRDMQGKPLRDVISTDAIIREGVLFGIHGGQINVTDGHYVYMRDPLPENKPLFEYTHMPTHMKSPFSPEEMSTMTIAPPFSFTKKDPMMKIEALPGFQTSSGKLRFGTRLYDLDRDPTQEHNINNDSIEHQMIELMIKLMKENDCPEEQFIRMGLKV